MTPQMKDELNARKINDLLAWYLPINNGLPEPSDDFESEGKRKIRNYPTQLSFVREITLKYLKENGCTQTTINDFIRVIFLNI